MLRLLKKIFKRSLKIFFLLKLKTGNLPLDRGVIPAIMNSQEGLLKYLISEPAERKVKSFFPAVPEDCSL